MATFSWSDNLKIAFRSCCLWPLQDDDSSLRADEGNGPINRLSLFSRSDDLQGLLANADSTDIEAERMSLHSNPGRGGSSQRKKKKRRLRKTSSSDNDNANPRRITLFGYNLFGRTPQIQLADDTEDALYSRRGSTTPNTLHRSSTVSSMFDSDAAPLDIDTITALSSPTTAKAAVRASAEVEAQRLKEKEERRRKRKEKKELKRMAELLARQGIVGDGEEFEGFQGSGAEHPRATQSTYPRIPTGIFNGSMSKVQGEHPTPRDDNDDDDDDKADFDGSHYARNTSGSSIRGSDDSRSRTSTTLSDRMHPTSEHTQSRQNGKKGKRSSSRTTKSSSSNASQLSSPRQMVSPSTIEQGQGFFDIDDADVPVNKPDPGYLPITGFGGTPATSRMASNLGAILAQRGGNDASGD